MGMRACRKRLKGVETNKRQGRKERSKHAPSMQIYSSKIQKGFTAKKTKPTHHII
jgi:hypothetical protein